MIFLYAEEERRLLNNFIPNAETQHRTCQHSKHSASHGYERKDSEKVRFNRNRLIGENQTKSNKPQCEWENKEEEKGLNLSDAWGGTE